MISLQLNREPGQLPWPQVPTSPWCGWVTLSGTLYPFLSPFGGATVELQFAVHIGPGADQYLVAVFKPEGPWAWHCTQYQVCAFSLLPKKALPDCWLRHLRNTGKLFWEGTIPGRDAKDEWVAKYKAWPLLWV